MSMNDRCNKIGLAKDFPIFERWEKQGKSLVYLDSAAMTQMPRADLPPGTVLEIFQPGYRLRERVVRPARVMVSRAPD